MTAVGTPLDRVDGRLKVTGGAIYAADTPVAHVLHAVIVGSRAAAGHVRLNTKLARKAPGVVTVLEPGFVPSLPAQKIGAAPTDRVLQLLQDDQVWYHDQPIAVVIADTLEHAQAAAALIATAYDAEPGVADLVQNLGAAKKPSRKSPSGEPDSKRGDVDAGLRRAATKISASYTTPIENHHPMEPHATVAVWSGDDRLTIYDATQGVFGVRARVAKAFGLPVGNVRVIDRFVGGGFGCKGSAWSHVVLAAMAARATGKPVKLVVTRPQMFALVGHRPRTVQTIELGAAAGGKLLAVRHVSMSETSRFDEFLEPCAMATRMLYSCDNVETSHRIIPIDIPTPTFQRAPGESSGEFALESAMDELAVALKMDPVALRLANYATVDENEGKPWSSKGLRECYARAAERFGWATRNPAPRATRRGALLVGSGMASATYPARQNPATARVKLRADGTALVQVGTQDLGTGTYTILTQIAADALGLPVDKVTVDIGDTALPEAPGSGGSTTAASAGSAVKVACELARAQLLPGMAEVTVEHKTEEYHLRKAYSSHAFGAVFAEVEVDEDLGHVRVARLVGAYAAGKILNPKTARSQLMGGLVWAIGMALEEHTVRDKRTARNVTRDLADYHVPVNADIPDLDVIFIDEHDPYVNEVGAKGIGEIGICGAPAAIANAIYHATGKRIRDLPITLDKLL